MPSTVDDPILYEVFVKYCHFGNRTNSLPATTDDTPNNMSGSLPQMEGSKFAKLMREAGFIENSADLTDIDITFSRVKDKNERKISYNQFRSAIKYLAMKKFKKEVEGGELDEGMAEERYLIVIRNLGGPSLAAGTTKPENSNFIERLMDGPATYISKSPRDEGKSWKDDLRRSSGAGQSSRRSSSNVSQNNSRKSSFINEIKNDIIHQSPPRSSLAPMEVAPTNE